ncbi:MAG: M23 family metallopeptidase [Oscillospiraceae bacterium]|jgi:murein DD-endopeptidase MepM/ murein hydrolase activator NlpD|nr:M23 family metallopeptidase [Oscillospiraceae bacterium]
MSKFKFKRGKFSKFMSSKGFYAAIAVCLVGAGLATWMAVDRTITGIEDSNSQIIKNDTSFSEFPTLEEVEKKLPDIPKVSASSSSSVKPSSSSEEQSKQEEPLIPAQAPQTSSSLVYALPVKGDILNQYSNGELVKNTTLNDWRTHDGVDLAAAKGDSVYAVADGTVTEVRKDSLWGTVIAIDHIDGKQSIYCGLSEIVPVKVGEAILAKQVIGTIEGIPCEMSENPHLHFAMKDKGAWIDPLSIVAKSE